MAPFMKRFRRHSFIGTQPLFIVIILWHIIMSLVLILSLEIIVISLNVFSLYRLQKCTKLIILK